MSNFKKLGKINAEQLRKYKGFENISNKEAEKEVDNIKALAKILYYIYLNEKDKQ